MRKLILSLVFVFATGTMMNAATVEVEETIVMDCIGMAFEADSKAHLSYEQFAAVVDSCESNQ